jgi:choline dehydrogenase
MNGPLPLDDGEYDYIIVGGGTAGCLLANRLSADPGVTVLLIEAGGRRRFWHRIPLGFRYTVGRPATDWMFETEPEPELNGRCIPFPRGLGLGGTSLINGMIHVRGDRHDYDRWVAAGARGWSWDEVLPYFKRSERHHAGASEFHGDSGEIHVERQRAGWPFLHRLAEAAVEMAGPWSDDFNTGSPAGTGWYEVTQHRGRRWDTGRAFVDPIRHRPNLRVLTEAKAEKITLQDHRTRGLSFRHAGVLRAAKARREVILAAGVIGSPQLLELSGIGNAAILAEAGVAPLVHLPDVGENLQDHLQVRTIWRLSGVATLNQQLGSRFGLLAMAARYALTRSGPLAMAPSQLGIFARSQPTKESADLQFHVVPYSADRVGGPPHPFAGFTMSVCRLDPESRGSVHLRSPSADAKPAIRANYLSAPGDRQVAIDALRLTRRIMTAPALKDINPEEMSPGRDAATDADLLSFVRATAGSIFHPVGTCRMGTDDRAVVDPALRVRVSMGCAWRMPR